jgi:hypothetical protein
VATWDVHLHQARHNTKLSDFLVGATQGVEFCDWAITTAFYSAVHSVEALVYFETERHCETSIPLDPATGRQQCTPHTWREKVVENRFGRDLWIAYRHLREASESVRYLSNRSAAFLKVPAVQEYPLPKVKILLQASFARIRIWSRLCILEDLLEARAAEPRITEEMLRKLLGAYKSAGQLRTDRTIAAKVLSVLELGNFETGMIQAGKWPARA